MVEGRSKSEVARDYGVSRRWVVTLVQRFVAEGEAGLEPRSRRPRRSPHRIAEAIEDQIVALRKELDDAGHDSGAETIAAHLERRRGYSPAVSTIWRVLVRRGFFTPQPHKRPKSSFVRFCAEQPNERWQLDLTHWALADGSGVEILNIIDDHSRVAVASVARRSFKAGDVVACFSRAAARYGLPAQMLSDNAAVFTGIPRGGGWVALELDAASLGSAFATLAHTTPRPAEKSSGSTRPSSAGWAASRPRRACGAFKVSSTASPTTTTPTGPIGPWADAPRRKPLRPVRRPGPPASRSPMGTSGCATTASIRAEGSPFATTASSITSASAGATPASVCSCSSTTCT